MEPSPAQRLRGAPGRFRERRAGRVRAFLEGFLIEEEGGGYGYLARVAGVAVAPDGALFVSDDSGGVIYRVTHDAASAAATASAAPAPIPNSVAPPPETDLAMALVEAASDAALEVSAPFAAGEPVPAKHSADGDNASPALAWTGAPDDAASFVVLMEDPDADAPVPFVHWIVYDLPADVTSLREGLPTDPILPDPEGVKQGANSMGATGYFGPKPPVGDPPHSYHFQVFALDVPSLDLDPGAAREDVLAAMQGHVLAKGETVGAYERQAAAE